MSPTNPRRTDAKHLLEDSSVFCMAPWVHIHSLPHGKVFPCCASGHNHALAIGDLSAGETLEDSWNSPRMKRLRADMLAGEPNKLCDRCHEYEGLGKESERAWFNRDFAGHFDRVAKTDAEGSLPGFDPPYIDIRFSNICNLRCRICLHELSSAWHQDAKALGWISKETPVVVRPTEDEESLWKQLEPLMPTVERIHFSGGEPLLMEEHQRMLDSLIEQGRTDVRLTYNTNFSKLDYRGRSVLETWKHFEHVFAFASLDGMGARGDYMRKGQDWETVVDNRRRMLQECPHVDFMIDSAVSIMNALHMPDFYNDWVSQGLLKPSGMNLYLLFEPHEYSIQGMLPHLKKQVEERYATFIADELSQFDTEEVAKVRSSFEAVVKHMNAEQLDTLEAFRRRTARIDDVRGENFSDVFPELSELVDNSNTGLQQ